MTTTDAPVVLGAELRESAVESLVRLGPMARLRTALKGDGLDAEAWRTVAEMGWFRLLLDEADGGMAQPLSSLGHLFRALGEHPLPGPFVDHAVVAPLTVLAHPERGGERLRAAIAGERLLSFVDHAQPATLGRKQQAPAAGEGRLRGAVDLVRCADRADDLLVVAQAASADPVLLLVATDAPGVAIHPHSPSDPVARLSRVELDLPLDACEQVAAGEQAVELLGRVRAALRLTAGAELAGLCTRMTAMSTEYAGTRQQFGRPIGSFQGVKHLLAWMFTRASGLENLLDAVLDDLDADGGTLEHGALVLKGHASSVARGVAEDALQVHGGIGFTTDHDLHLFFKRALSLQGFYGDERQIARRLAAGLLETGPDGPLQP